MKAGSQVLWGKSGVTHLSTNPGIAVASCELLEEFAVRTADVDIGHLLRGGAWNRGSEGTGGKTRYQKELKPPQVAGADGGERSQASKPITGGWAGLESRASKTITGSWAGLGSQEDEPPEHL